VRRAERSKLFIGHFVSFGVFVFNFAVHSVGDFNFGTLFDFPEEVKDIDARERA
jgi:hypothetical protein